MKMLKKILASKLFRLLLSSILIYFAFKKVDLLSLWRQVKGISWYFILVNILLSSISVFLISFRWSLLLIKKPRLSDVLVFAKSSFISSFYGLFFNTSVAGDFFKWMIIERKYPELPKSKLFGSVFLDRFIGLSMFVFLGTVMIFLAKIDESFIPLWVKLVFLG
jgi:hypothetical protein